MIQPIEKNNEVKLTIYSLLPGDQEFVKRTKVALVIDHQKYEDTEYGIKFYPHNISFYKCMKNIGCKNFMQVYIITIYFIVHEVIKLIMEWFYIMILSFF